MSLDAEPNTTVTLPDDAEIVRVAAMNDPILRNLWITEYYARFARRLLDRLETDQTWCTFAIWASNTAGLSIRQRELPHVVDELLDGADHHIEAVAQVGSAHHPLVDRFVAPLRRAHIDRIVRTALGQVAEHIAHGNALVFAELAPLFARFIEVVDRRDLDRHDVDEILDLAGIPPEPRLVHDAFRSYAMALANDDDSQRAQFVLAGNISAVLHEQQRLQDDVAAALDAGLVDVATEIERLCSRFVPGFARRRIAAAAQRRVAHHVEMLWDHIATRLLMTMVVPGETLHLSRDVPPPPGRPLFPPCLDPVTSSELQSLLRAWDPTDGTGVGAGAADWADLHSRMGFIVNLFRSRQRVIDLTASPFTAEQLAAMARGETPEL